MTALETMTEFIGSFPDFDILDAFHVDYIDQLPSNGGIRPSGLEELERRYDIFGNCTIRNRLNFAIYAVFPRAPGDDTGSKQNAEWVVAFQDWIQTQSASGAAPAFGDIPRRERITASNGELFEANDEGLAIYMVQLGVEYYKRIEVNNPWLI